MPAPAANSLLHPTTLAGLANLELVARSAVEGFFQGLHRSPRFGFSQEFAEYRAYVEGDDPRFVDWNVYARTDRTYIKRFQGETNTRLMIALDASASMGFGAGPVTKLRYAKFLAAALAYMAIHQHDPVGLIAFDDAIRTFRPPSSRAGSLPGILHALDAVQPGKQTDINASLQQLREHFTRRGLVAVISDLYCDPKALTRAVQPLAYRGHDIMIFQILDREEMEPKWRESVLLEDMESGLTRDVSPDWIATHYKGRLQQHLDDLRRAAAGVGAQQTLIVTDEPLDRALRRYLQFRQKHD
ncbi:MAG TPA: DUF58 domain-containing protein [Steroidobacteraceae bacterium]|jgi:uncharacterized protein (DUF58 family)|nr:DUF58 domain-containing protein [Steroidobacteraceae bacterium]